MAVAERHVWEVGGKQGFPPAGTHRRNIMRGSPSLAHLNCQISISLFHTDSFISEIIPGNNMITAPSKTTDDSRGIKKKKKKNQWKKTKTNADYSSIPSRSHDGMGVTVRLHTRHNPQPTSRKTSSVIWSRMSRDLKGLLSCPWTRSLPPSLLSSLSCSGGLLFCLKRDFWIIHNTKTLSYPWPLLLVQNIRVHRSQVGST